MSSPLPTPSYINIIVTYQYSPPWLRTHLSTVPVSELYLFSPVGNGRNFCAGQRIHEAPVPDQTDEDIGKYI